MYAPDDPDPSWVNIETDGSDRFVRVYDMKEDS